jgi:signal peptidase I
MSKAYEGKTKEPQPGGFWYGVWDWVKSLAIAIVLALVIKTTLVEAYKIPSGSMENTLLVGDFLLANKFLYGAKLPILPYHLPALREPKPGDVIIFKYPGDGKTNYIKRLIAVAGQTVKIVNKRVYVDGKALSLPRYGKTDPGPILPHFPGGPYAPFSFSQFDGSSAYNRDNFGPFTVPPGGLFVMGDNRDNSFDSRFWGPVPRGNVMGKALVIHWSWERSDGDPEIDLAKPWTVGTVLAYDLLHIPVRVRWGRLAHLIN